MTDPMIGNQEQFGEVIARSIYGTTGYLSGSADLDLLEQVIAHNLAVLRQFRYVVVATNYPEHGRAELSAANARVWRRHLPDCVLIDSRVNRGHSIGSADLDNALFDYARGSGARWLCKGANDVWLSDALLSFPVRSAQFYYLPAASAAALAKHQFQLHLFDEDYLYPQTTFYAIEVPATDYLTDPVFLDRSWRTVAGIPGYNGRIWEYIPGWSCEALLRGTVLRNQLSRSRLLTDQQWQRVLDLVIAHRIEDCSFKGLSINGICHGAPPGREFAVVR